jgi:hypothetical protein
VLFRLGELVAHAECAAIFAERSVNAPTTAVAFDPPLQQAMARVFARQAAAMVAFDGLRWAVGAGQTDPALGQSLNLAGAGAAQAGLIDDMDFVAKRLCECYQP